jgi:glycosyltransferase involved in cell wall biosynthesis
VVVPACNAETTITAAIRSILDQTVQPLEIIVVDDGSSDRTPSILEEFGESIVVIRQPNSGLASARHTGIAAAKGELIALMDADDLCEPDRLAIQVAYLARYPEVVFCATDFSAFDANGLIAERHAHTYYSELGDSEQGAAVIFPFREIFHLPDDVQVTGQGDRSLVTYRGDVYERIALGNFMHPPTVMFRRDVLAKAGNYDPTWSSQSDWEWFTRVARTGQFGFIAHPLLAYRISDSQISSRRHWLRRCLGINDVYERAIARDPALYRSQRHAFDQRMRDNYVDSADASAESSGLESIKWLLRTVVKYRYLSPRMGRILVKALMPAWALPWFRKTT